MTDQYIDILKLVAGHPACTSTELGRILDILVSDTLSLTHSFKIVITRWCMHDARVDRLLNKVPPIRAIRELTQMSLKEAKNFIEDKYEGEHIPVIILNNLCLRDADIAKEVFKNNDCDVRIELDR